MDSISYSCRKAPRHITYANSIRNNVEAFLVLRPGVFGLLDCNVEGKLTKKYVIIEVKHNEDRTIEYLCSCKQSNCLHVTELKMLSLLDNNYSDETELFEYQYLNSSLIGIYCKEDATFSILRETKAQLKCLKCQNHVKSCIHVSAFNDYIAKNGVCSTNIREQQKFESISTELIPYPLIDDEDLETFKGYVSGDLKYPTELVPQFDASKKCIHGNPFNQDITVELRQAKLHLAHFSRDISIHYRPAIGCDCQQYYEGRSQLLFNLNNKHIFSYIWLYDILHNIQESHFTLHGAYRSANNTRIIGDQIELTKSMYQNLRLAYNCFIRLLDLDFEDL